MPRSTYAQSGFLGGLWSPLAQGRFDQPFYRQALNVCLNAIIVEEGPWVRRSGTEILGPTYLRNAAKFLPLQSSAATPYLMEITNSAGTGSLRLWYGTGPVVTNDSQVLTASTSASGTLTLTTKTNHGWAVGDHILIAVGPLVGLTGANIAVIQGRHLLIATQNGTTGLTANDDVGAPLPSNITAGGLIGATVFRVKRFDTLGLPVAALAGLRSIQAQTQCVLLSGGAPQLITATDVTATTDPTVTVAAAIFLDGPYMDPDPLGGTVTGYSGSINFTPTNHPFVITDIGRSIRFFTQPPIWVAGTTYTNGQQVTDSAGAWWEFTYSSGLAGVVPGTSATIGGVVYLPWAPAPAAGVWAWGTITNETGSQCTVSLTTNLPVANGAVITQFMMGLYRAGQYPTCGVYHEGRLWLAGAIPNRFDASMSNALLTFSPTDVNGNVLDNSAIAETLNFYELSNILWMKPDHQGIVVGTNGGTVLISASALHDPLTPTSIQAHRVSPYMSANVEPHIPGIATIFVQRYQQRIIEHMADAFSGKFSGRHVNEFAKDLAAAGVKELAYQEEKAPIIWALMNDGTMAGCTYRRVSRFTSEPPVMEAWFQLALGDGSIINTMCVLPGVDGLSDALYVCPSLGGQYWVDLLRPIFEEA